VPRFCEIYPGIFLTTEEKARQPLRQGSSTAQYKNNEWYNTVTQSSTLSQNNKDHWYTTE
jgi:hypothetical protein